MKPPFPHTPARTAHGHLYVNTVMKGRVWRPGLKILLAVAVVIGFRLTINNDNTR